MFEKRVGFKKKYFPCLHGHGVKSSSLILVLVGIMDAKFVSERFFASMHLKRDFSPSWRLELSCIAARRFWVQHICLRSEEVQYLIHFYCTL